MGALVYNGFDFGEFCRAKTVGISPVRRDGNGAFLPLDIQVKLMLDTGAKMDAFALSAIRHKLNAALAKGAGTLRLPEEPELEYRSVSVAEADPWKPLFEDGSCLVAFCCADPVAYGHERKTARDAVEVGGTYRTYPAVELVAVEGDSVMVMDAAQERFVQIVGAFTGGERVMLDFERERASIDGVSADKSIGLYSDFFPLHPGVNTLIFAGCSAHTVRFAERWV